MKKSKLIAVTTIALSFLLISSGRADNDIQMKNKLIYTFDVINVSGTVTNGNPDFSWVSVPGTSYYKVNRYPVPALGGVSKQKHITTSLTSYIDTEVHGAVVGSGFDQVRYIIEAFDSNNDIIDTGVIDYTADSID